MQEEMRKIVQIEDTEKCLIALCNDGSLWYLQAGSWSRLLPEIPQHWEEKENEA